LFPVYYYFFKKSVDREFSKCFILLKTEKATPPTSSNSQSRWTDRQARKSSALGKVG